MKALHQYFLVIAISLLPFIPFFISPDMPHTHDGPVHLARMPAYFKAITDGQFLPRWASDLNYGYGMPLFNFIYHTPYLLSSILISLGVGLVATFKIVLTISFLLSGIGMFALARELFRDTRAALFVTITYQFAPFRFVESHIRGSFGEVFTYTTFPFFLLGLIRLTKHTSLRNIVLPTIAGAFLILSHNSVSLLFFGFAVTLGIALSKSWRTRFYQALAIIGSLALSATYWLPALMERKFTYGDLFMKDIFGDHFPPIIQLILPNLTNDIALQTEGIAVQIGIFHIAALVAAGLFIIKKNSDRQTKIISGVIIVWSIVALFFMSPLSRPVWSSVALLRQFQFPWRFLAITVVTSSMAGAMLIKTRFFSKTSIQNIVLGLIVASTIFFWNPPLGFDVVDDERIYWDYPLNTTFYGETDVIWSAGQAKTYAPSPVQIASGNASISNFIKRSTHHTFNVTASEPTVLVDNTQYFPGWRAQVDGEQVPIEFQDQNWRGLITFPVPSGDHAISVSFNRSPIRLIADLASLVSIIFVVVILWVTPKKSR